MHVRGRSRDISPIALAKTAPNELYQAQLSLAFVPQSNLEPVKRVLDGASAPSRCPPCHGSQPLRYTLTPQPVASSSRMDPSPPFSHSHSSTASTSPEPTPAPATPPELTQELFPIHCHRSRPVPLDYWESPPSPPRTLKDQMHVAYAHDNFHLAKILLLKLKGIEVTDDNDPRIDEVTDEDFESAFVPRGKFKLDEEAQRRCLEGEQRERERLRRRVREERLRTCEHIWESSARCIREEKARNMRKKEEEARVRRRAEIEARERDREAREREKERDLFRYPRNMRSSRAVLSYGDLPASLSRVQASTSRSPPKTIENGPLFEYALMPPVPVSRLSPSKPRNPPSSPNRALRDLAALNATSVTFSEVVRSMHGPLFPVDDVTERPRQKRNAVQLDLLDTLLNTSPWDARVSESVGSSRSGTGVKDKHRVPSVTNTITTEPSITSSSLSVLSRSMSWFSFGSRTSSKQSVSTSLTTSISPGSPFKVQVFSSPTLVDCSTPGTEARHLDRHPHTPHIQCIPVASSDHPLSVCVPHPSVKLIPSSDSLCLTRGRPLTRRQIIASSSNTTTFNDEGLVKRISRSVSSFIDAAAQFHRAYVKATIYTASQDFYFSDSYASSRPRSTSRSRTRSRTVTRGRGAPLRPAGYRASCEDVFSFTSSGPDRPEFAPQRAHIPLEYTRAASATLPEAPRVFAAPPPIPRSPFRLPYPPTKLTSRLRPIANPLLLRLRALENAYGNIQTVHEIREKIVGVAWEGIGRSGLVREVKPSRC